MSNKKNSIEFEEIFRRKVEDNPYIKRFACYMEAEQEYVIKHGRKKYSNYESFKVVASRRANRKRR